MRFTSHIIPVSQIRKLRPRSIKRAARKRCSLMNRAGIPTQLFVITKPLPIL